MKKVFLLSTLVLLLSCSKSNDVTPDYTGTYGGSLTGSCAALSGTTPIAQSFDVQVVKNGSDYVLKKFDDKYDLKLIFNSSGSTFSISTYTDNGTTYSNTGSFSGKLLTISGTGKSTTSSSFCSYSYQGTKK